MATTKHYGHMTLETRKSIEDYATEGRTLAFMSRELDIDAASISRELKRNRRCDGLSGALVAENKCIHRKIRRKRHICDPDCKKRCASCVKMCRAGECENYEQDRCRRTRKAPWVCNGCPKRCACPLERFAYSAKVAQAKADSRLVESREGLDMTGLEMEFLAKTVEEGLALGQSAHHVFAAHVDLPCSERSFYRHVENESMDVRKMDLRKKVKHKKRNAGKANRHEAELYLGRTHGDYLALPKDRRAQVVQMDCVEGAQEDARALLTLHFAALRFQIHILLERKDAKHAVAALNWIEPLVGRRYFKKLFGLILADRGCEFDDIAGIESDGRCSACFADPQRPDQKGGCEKNHVELRKIIPKGTSLDEPELNQRLVAGICSRASSSLRLSIGDASPMALAKAALPASLLEGLGLDIVLPGDVETRPELINRLKQDQQAQAK